MTGTECCRAAMTIMGAGADSSEYYAQFALGQQHRGHGLVLLSGGFGVSLIIA